MHGQAFFPVARRKRAFTLTELLVVVAIIAVVTGLTVTRLDFGKAARLDAAGSRVVDLAHLARQNSISKSALTALIVVTDPAIQDKYRAVALLELLPRSDGATAAPSDWHPVTKWEALESGVIFDPSAVPNNALQDSSQATLTPAFPSLQYQGHDVGQYKYLVFLPNGSLYPTGANPAILSLVEGFFPPSSGTPVYTRRGSATVNAFRITVLAANGATKIDRP